MVGSHEAEFNQCEVTYIKSKNPQEVAEFIREAVDSDIERESNCRNKKERERESYQMQNAFFQAVSASPEKIERKNIRSRNDIFTDFLKRGESGSFRVSDGKYLPVKDHCQEKRKGGQICPNNGL